MTNWKYKPLTEKQKAAGRELIETPENQKLRKALVQDYVKSKGTPTITCEMIDDTEWLK